jgi:hypothetical protein
MLRTALAGLVGVLAGVGLTVLLLWLTHLVLDATTAPQVFRIEHGVVYTTVVLGAGFGGLCGTLVGLAGVVVRGLRDRTGAGR